jgi:hypothetical protein
MGLTHLKLKPLIPPSPLALSERLRQEKGRNLKSPLFKATVYTQVEEKSKTRLIPSISLRKGYANGGVPVGRGGLVSSAMTNPPLPLPGGDLMDRSMAKTFDKASFKTCVYTAAF